jgi:hypothetical protein
MLCAVDILPYTPIHKPIYELENHILIFLFAQYIPATPSLLVLFVVLPFRCSFAPNPHFSILLSSVSLLFVLNLLQTEEFLSVQFI